MTGIRKKNIFSNWLQSRSKRWVALSKIIKQSRGARDNNPDQVRLLLKEFRGLATDLSLARQTFGQGQITRQLEALYSQAHELIYHKAQNFLQDLIIIYRDEIPQIVTQNMRTTILFTISLFIGTGITGWLLVHAYPELASLFASEAMINNVQAGKLWTDDILNIAPSSKISHGIMANNIMVSFVAFLFGAFYGIGTLYIISLNGFMLGGIFAFTAHYGMDDRLFKFVFAHGVVELSVICLAGAAGIHLGEALIRPGNQSRGKAFHAAVSQAGKLLFVVVPFLVGAGYIEGYISPNHIYSMELRIFVGISYGLLLWVVLTGKIWRWGKRRQQFRINTTSDSAPANVQNKP